MRPIIDPKNLPSVVSDAFFGWGPSRAVQVARDHGWYMPPECVLDLCPTLAQIKKLEAAGKHRERNDLRTLAGAPLIDMEHALKLSEGLRVWAETTSAEDDAKRAAEQREKERIERRSRFVIARASQIRAERETQQRAVDIAQAAAEFDAQEPPHVTPIKSAKKKEARS